MREIYFYTLWMETVRHWRLQTQRYNLVGEECGDCGSKIFPPRDACPDQECLAPVDETTNAFQFSGSGKVYSHTTIYDVPAGFEPYVPYTVALVKLEEGPLVTSQLTDVDPDDVEIGMSVEMVTRKLRTDGKEGMIVYGYKFRPIIEKVAIR